jgi:hypothetical protein
VESWHPPPTLLGARHLAPPIWASLQRRYSPIRPMGPIRVGSKSLYFRNMPLRGCDRQVRAVRPSLGYNGDEARSFELPGSRGLICDPCPVSVVPNPRIAFTACPLRNPTSQQPAARDLGRRCLVGTGQLCASPKKERACEHNPDAHGGDNPK